MSDSPNKTEQAQKSTKEIMAEIETTKVVSDEAKSKSPKISSELDDYINRAKRAQEQRRNAPPVKVRGFADARLKVLIDKYATQTGGQDAPDGYHYMTGNRKDSKLMPDKGYEPVLDRGEQVTNNGDPMWRIPTWMYVDILITEAERSQGLLGAKASSDNKSLDDNPLVAEKEVTVTEHTM